MNGIKYIVKKELNRVFSDRKLIVSLFILPAVLVFAIMNLSGKLTSNKMDDIDKHIPSVYVQNAPDDFIQFVSTNDFSIDLHKVGDSEDINKIQDQIKDGDVDLMYVFDKDFADHVTNYESDKAPNVQVYYNSSEDYSSAAKDKFAVALAQYQQSLLATRFGGIEKLTAFQINESDIVDDKKASNTAFAMILPYVIPMLMFSSAMGLGTDAITGEKERGTLASMLLTPVKRRDLVLGKIISLTILASMSAIIYGVSMIFSFSKMVDSMGEGASVSFSFTPVQVVQLLVLMLGMVFSYVALIGVVSIFAKTAKEASTYVMPIYIIVIVSGLITMFTGGSTPATYRYMIPLYGNTLAMQGIIDGSITAAKYGVSLLGTIVLGVVLLFLMTKAFNSEKVMFNA